jgi:hypothetical protein
MVGGGNNRLENAGRNRLEESVTGQISMEKDMYSCDDMENDVTYRTETERTKSWALMACRTVLYKYKSKIKETK